VKKFLLILMGLTPVLLSVAQYKIVDSKSSVKFKIKNLGFNVDGTFSGLEGNISFDPNRPEEAMFKVSMNASTVNTGIDMRDSHLKKESYFNAEKYPKIVFESTKVLNSKKKSEWIIYGKLTMKNHSKDISFPFTAEPAGDGMLFKGLFSINRKDFDVGGTSVISNNVDVSLQVTADK
jgi:polyisoprenoid-binding protein YceI